MGLDAVELVMDFEEAFQMSLSDEEMRLPRTPGKVADVIFSRMKTVEENKCKTQAEFYKIRRILSEKFQVSRKDIRPNTLLETILPVQSRISEWQCLLKEISEGKTIHANLKGVMAIELTLLLINFVLIVLSIYFLLNFNLIAFLFIFSLPFLSERVYAPWRVNFPKEFQNVKDLIKICYTTLKPRLSREEILEIVINITSDKLQIEKSKIKEDSSFIDDLGLD